MGVRGGSEILGTGATWSAADAGTAFGNAAGDSFNKKTEGTLSTLGAITYGGTTPQATTIDDTETIHHTTSGTTRKSSWKGPPPQGSGAGPNPFGPG